MLKNKGLIQLFAYGVSAVALGLAVPSIVMAQTDAPIQTIPVQTINDQSDEPDFVNLSAETVTYDENAGLVTASGAVLVRHKGFELLADQVIYDRVANTVKAVGNVRITGQDGHTLYVDEAELNEELSEGFVENVRLLMSDQSRLAAKSGQRLDGNITTLDEAVYSPCKVCDETPDAGPVWQLKAVKVTHDQNKKKLIYTDAYLELFGIPVLYTPYLSHPDPTVDRASGFLTPDIQTRRELGVVIATPYYHVINDSSDITFTPTLTTREGVVLGTEYRRHIGFGQFNVGGSATYPEKRDENAQVIGGREFRGHFYTNGQFNLGDGWRSDYDLKLSSDDTYLRRYGYSNDDTLTSSLNVEKFDDRSYAGINSYFFQGLRQEDIQGLTGLAMPMLTYDKVNTPDQYGGVWRYGIRSLALQRTDGMDTFRLSGDTSWAVPYVNALGQMYQFKASLRADAYHIRDADRPDIAFFAGEDGTHGRFLPHVEASARWPLVKEGETSQQILEPIITIVAASSGGEQNQISNEDSRTFELSDANLFAAQRFPGLDRWEGGVRASYGVKWSINRDDLNSEIMIGQSIRADKNDVTFPVGSGLSGNFSDFVGKWDLSLRGLMRLAYRFRFDKDRFILRRNEADISFGDQDNWLSLGYFQTNRDRSEQGLEDREEIRAAGSVKVDESWYLHGNITQNLTNGSHGIEHSLGLRYMDDCLEFGLTWRKSYTTDRDIVPGSTFLFKIRLKQLG